LIRADVQGGLKARGLPAPDVLAVAPHESGDGIHAEVMVSLVGAMRRLGPTSSPAPPITGSRTPAPDTRVRTPAPLRARRRDERSRAPTSEAPDLLARTSVAKRVTVADRPLTVAEFAAGVGASKPP
jgi:hypothetical protein